MDRFEISGSDRRDELIAAIERGHEFITQKPTGKEVELFDPDYGFYLARKEAPINPNQKQILRAYALAKVSYEVPRVALRELYYLFRGGDIAAKYGKYFDVRKEQLYDEILERINTLEIIADMDRILFTISTSSKGYIYYPYSYDYGDAKRKVAFTEELAIETLNEWDLPDVQNVLVVEKEAAANRLIEIGFPELANTAIVTVGGAFNRAIFKFAQRFNDVWRLTFLCDGDVYGGKILSTVRYGSDRSRHLNLRVKDGIHIAGLYPDVCAKLGIPTDEDQAPSKNKRAAKMLEHLKANKLADPRDLEAWEKDLTYELESLSQAFKSKTLTDEKGAPQLIGLGIYLTEFMRLKGIPPKPMPTDDVKEDFRDSLKIQAKDRLKPYIDTTFIDEAIERIREEIERVFEDFKSEVAEQELRKHEVKIDGYVDKTDVELIKKHLIAQYCKNMRKQKYSVPQVVRKVLEAEIKLEWDEQLFQEIKEEIEKAIDELIQKIKPRIERLLQNAKWESKIELEELKDIEVCDLYDKILEELGADPKDAEKVRQALKARLS